jgi:DNA-binding SARP family transcriptional activator
MRFCLLGPLRVRDGDSDIEIKGDKRRLLLAALLLEAGRPVSKQQLIAVLWDDRPPPSAVHSLHNRVLALRRELHDPDGALLRTTASGYLLDVDAADVDALEFEQRLAAGRAAYQASDWSLAAAEFRAALALWRGEPLSDLPPVTAFADIVTRWSELRLQALDRRIDCDLRLGRHAG